MSVWHFFLFLVLAGLAGSLGQAIAGYSRGGWLASIALGFIGAALGTWLARALGFPNVLVVSIDGQPFPLVWATLGAALLVAVLGLVARSRFGRHPPG
jgi:uncharacterized membrane protein YeaQ/YmgE (transglycosylase-associated protein family)